MKSARASAILFVVAMISGCQQTDEQTMASWLSRGLPRPFANCIAERTFDALTSGQEQPFRQAAHARCLRMPGAFPGDPPRTLVQAQSAITVDLPEDLAERVRDRTA